MPHTVMPGGDVLELSRDAAVLRFAGRRKTLSTGSLGGGLRTDLTALFNHNDCPRAGAYCRMEGDHLEDHQRATAEKLGLAPHSTTGLNTGANIDNTAIVTLRHEELSVTAIVTGGVEVNACRVGNPATLHEREGKTELVAGTINILLAVDAHLTDGCMARALATCVEGKTAALQELLVSDRYGSGLATGSGTDGIVVVSNMESPLLLREAGTHYKLGELIGRATIQGVKEALYRQSGLSPGLQHSVFRRLERYGVTLAAIKGALRQADGNRQWPSELDAMLEQMSLDGTVVTFASLYAHLMDQISWGLLLPQEGAWAGDKLLELLNTHHGMPHGPAALTGREPKALIENMADAFIRMIVRWVLVSLPE